MKGFALGTLLLIVTMFGLGVQAKGDYTSVSAAYSALSKYTFGDGLCEYSTSTYTATEVNNYLTQAQSATDDSDSELLSVLNTIDSELALNMPEAGTFLRIRSVYIDGYYLSSTTSSDVSTQAAVTNDATGAETIFYYDGTSIVSYAKGNYPTASTNTSYYGVNFDTSGSTLTVSFDTIYDNGNNSGTAGTYIGAYSICYGGSYTLSCDNSSYIKGMTSKRVSVGGSWAAFYLEEVTTLPVTLGSTGYATIYSPVALTVPDGVTTHTATIANGEATYSDDLGLTTIPANSGVVLKGTESETISLTTATTTDEESETATASDDDSDEIEYMSGQIVTTTASGTEYVLGDEGTWTKASSGDELTGFTAYAVSTTYDADDLANAWSDKIGSHVVGDSLGQYTATISGSDTYSDYASLLAAVEELIANTDAESSDYESMISELSSITITFTLNSVKSGTFLRISSVTDTPYYLTSSNGSTAINGVYPVATTTERDGAGTIFYYDGTYLLNYETGYYIAAVTGTGNAFASYNGITTGASITFGEGTQTGGYYIKFASRYLYAADNGYTNGGSSYSSDTLYSFYIEEVDTLPVTTNTGGYATLYSPVALTVPDDVTISTVSWSTDDSSWTTTEQSSITTLAAETPVLVKGTASTTYGFVISSDDGTTISDNTMGGQIATAYATDHDQYTLTDAESLSFTAATVGETELQGFTAYAVGEETDYTASDVETAWSNLTSSYSSYTIGTALGEYTVTISGSDVYTSYSELAAAVEALIEEGDSADSDACKSIVASIDSITLTYTINLPTAGMFLRLQNAACTSNVYLSSGNGGTRNSNNCAAMSDDTGAATIFYYDGSYLINYETGLYLVASASSYGFICYNGIQTSGSTLTFTEGMVGTYKVSYTGGRYMHGGAGSGYVNAGGTYSSGSGYDWYLTEITELPVELDAAGLAVVSAPVKLAVPDEVTAVYSLAWNSDNTDLTVDSTATAATIIPASTAVLIKGEAEATVTLTVSSDEASTISDNALTSTLATIAGDDTYYTLAYTDGYSQFVQTTDTVWGFSGYLTASSGSSYHYFTSDYEEATAVADWDGLKAAIDTLSTVGENLGEYSVTGYDYDEVAAVLARAQALYEEQSDETSAGTVALYIDSLLTYYDAGLTLNMPTAGMFLRIESKAGSGYYLSSSSSGTTYSADNSGAETIYYYDGSSLLSYGTGNYPTGSSSGMSFETIGGYTEVSFDTIAYTYTDADGNKLYSTIVGAYSIHYYNSDASATYVLSYNSGSVTGMTDRVAAGSYSPAFYLTEVTELPVTMNESGYKAFYSPVALSVPSGVTVYSVLNDNETIEKTAVSLSVLAAETPVLLSGTAGSTYTFTVSSETGTTISDNSLVGQLAAAYSTGVEYTLSGSDFAITTSGSDVVDGFSAYLTEASSSLTIDDEGYQGFIRIQSVANSTYLASSNYGTVSNASRAAFVSDGDSINTIMYYDDTNNTLISYETGYYLAALSGTYGYYPGWNGVTDAGYVDIVASSNTSGAYCILFYKTSGRYLYSNSSGYSDCGSSDDDTGYRYYIECLDALPVTLDANGYGTLYTPVALTIPSGVDVYVLTINDDESFSETELLGTIPAGSVVYLKGIANTEYSFPITSSSKSAQTGSLLGQAATQSSIDYAYTLQAGDEYSTFEYDDGEIQGFKAYYVGEDESSSYATEDIAVIVALTSVVNDYEADAATYTIGSSLGEYSYGDYDSDQVLALIAEAEALLETSNIDADRAKVVADSLEIILAETLALNMPEAGMFFRIRTSASWISAQPYLGSENSTSSTTRAAFVDSADGDNEFGTIFYYDGTYLVNYGTGYYPCNRSNFVGYNGVTTGTTFSFQAATYSEVGAYNVIYVGTSSVTRYMYTNTSYYTDGGSSASGSYGYNFNLESVYELPVTTNEGGGATLYTPVALEIPDGVTAYKIAIESDGDMTKTAIEGSVIPAGTAFYFEGEYSTTYYFTITESSESAITSDLTGQVATQSSQSNAYVLSVSNLLNKFVSSSDELQGFTAYLSYSGSTTTDGEINFDGLSELDFSSLLTAIEAFDDYPQGDGLGEYTYSEALVTLLETAQELYDLGYNGSTTADDITSMINSLESQLEVAYQYLNMPDKNSFFRMRTFRHTGYYVSSTSTSDTGLNIVSSCTDDNEAGTIFYYGSDGSLLNYESGIYVDANGSTAYYNGVQSSCSNVFDFSYSGYTTPTVSAYCVKFTKDGTSLMLANLATNTYTTAVSWSSSYSNQAYDFYLEDVESLPVTTDDAGYATLYSPVAVEVPSGVSIYILTYDETSNLLTKTLQKSMTVIPAETAVMIVGTANKTYNFTLTTESGSAVNGTNNIVGQLATALSTGEEYTLQYSEDDETSNFTVTTATTDSIHGFTGYMKLNGEVTISDVVSAITLTTAKSSGEEIEVLMDYGVTVTLSGAVRASDSAEEYTSLGKPVAWTLSAQTVTITSTDKIKMFYAPDAEITSINVGSAPYLEKLYLPNNSLETLDVQFETELQELNVAKNSLTTLTIGDNLTDLEILDCSDNSSLTDLDVSGLSALEELNIANDKAVTSLTLSSEATPTVLIASYSGLTSLPENLNTEAMKVLWFQGCSLSELDLSASSDVRQVYAPAVGLETISLGKQTGLTDLWIESNELTSDTLDLSNVKGLVAVSVSDNGLTDILWNTTNTSTLAYFYGSNNGLFFNSLPTLTSSVLVDCKFANQETYTITDQVLADAAYDWTTYLRRDGFGVTYDRTYKVTDASDATLTNGTDYTYSGYTWTFLNEQSAVTIAVTSNDSTLYITAFEVLDPQALIDFEEYVGGYSTEQLADLKVAYAAYKSDASDDNYEALYDEVQSVLASDKLALQDGYYYNIFSAYRNAGWYLYNEPTIRYDESDTNDKGISTTADSLQILYGDSTASNYFAKLWTVELNSDGTFKIKNANSDLYINGTPYAYSSSTNCFQIAADGDDAGTFSLSDKSDDYGMAQWGIYSETGKTYFNCGLASTAYYKADTYASILGYDMEQTGALYIKRVRTVPMTVSTKAEWATLCSPVAVRVADSELTAYTGVKVSGSNYVTPTEISDGVVPAETPVLLYAEGGGSFTLYIQTTDSLAALGTLAASSLDNDLKGVTLRDSTMTPRTYYGLSYFSSTGVGFYLSTLAVIAANKAYLPYETDDAESGYYLFGTPLVDGIEAVAAETQGDDEDDATIYYDLQGRRVVKPQKGVIYITNKGKKVLYK